MADRHHTRAQASAIRLTIAGLAVGAALFGAASAVADPAVPVPTPVPGDPAPAPPGGPAAVDPGQPDPAAAPLPPAGPPSVPEIANPVYGSGQNGSGVFGTLKDLWHQARDPYYGPEETPGAVSGSLAPPPGAGPAPALPPGYVSFNAPGSETAPASAGAGGTPAAGGPALPPGYYPLTGPPPPGYEFATPGQPAAAPAPTTAVPTP
ncbi:hypothetical protein BayCH28_11425 [Mycolicibacterium sp. CH28]|uniref:hypothetical protein n=1 Tax=Mycolicibacterium sp. CH28 TaxID=2512237 RepID=UPI00108036D1|nr:hypothetical protein [Mycolicibacterium sp. CH28]TGD88349.1 hypothetical protein BayCH28_11425 [Mycolicibacterium sp. CH28]